MPITNTKNKRIKKEALDRHKGKMANKGRIVRKVKDKGVPHSLYLVGASTRNKKKRLYTSRYITGSMNILIEGRNKAYRALGKIKKKKTK